MARSALNWTAQTLAEKAGLSTNTVLALESGRVVYDSTIFRIQQALEAGGAIFIDRGVQVAEKT